MSGGVMDKVRFTGEDIEALTLRIGTLAAQLTDHERNLLLAIFAAAADRVDSDLDRTEGTLPAAHVSGEEPRADDHEMPTAEEFAHRLLHARILSYEPSGSFSDRIMTGNLCGRAVLRTRRRLSSASRNE